MDLFMMFLNSLFSGMAQCYNQARNERVLRWKEDQTISALGANLHWDKSGASLR